jgi:hypothetical protein
MTTFLAILDYVSFADLCILTVPIQCLHYAILCFDISLVYTLLTTPHSLPLFIIAYIFPTNFKLYFTQGLFALPSTFVHVPPESGF